MRGSKKAIGYSCAGRVLAIGKGIKDLFPGDRVACGGAAYAHHAELVSVPRNLVVKVPAGIPLEQASSATIGAIAMQGVRRADPRLIRTAREVNDAQSLYVVEMIKQVVELNGPGRIAFLGLTYKANINDTRESPSFPMIKYFYERNYDLIVYDPFVKQCDYPLVDTFEDAIATSRYLVFLVEHKKFLAPPVVLKNKIIIDVKNIFGRMDLPEGVKIYTLGKSEHKIEAHG